MTVRQKHTTVRKKGTIAPPKHTNDRHPNFRGTGNKLYLVRCYVCGGERGTENHALSVSSGQCAWCGWKE